MVQESFAPGTLFAKIFHASPVAMVVSTLEDIYIDVNQAYCDLTGHTRAALIGRAVSEIELPPVTGSDCFDPSQPIVHVPVNERKSLLLAAGGEQRPVIVSTQVEKWGSHCYRITLIQDLTRITQTKEALQRSQTRFRLIFENIPLPVFVYDADTLTILDVNPAAVRHYGYSRDEFLRLSMLDVRPPGEQEKFLKTLHQLPNEMRTVGIWKHRKKDGAIIDVDVTSYGLQLDGRRTRLTVVRDVTERLAVQAALEAGEQRLRIIATVTADVIWEFDLVANRASYSPGLSSVFGYETGEETIAPEWWQAAIHPDDRQATMDGFAAAINGDALYWSADYRFRRADNRYAYVIDRGFIIRDADGRATRVIGAMVDLTHQVELKEAAEQAMMEERRRLARDLHDAVTQSLYSLSLMAEVARRRVQVGDVQATVEYIQRLGELAQQSLKEMRLLVYELRPSALEREGLAGAVQERLDAVERRSGMTARLHSDGTEQLSANVQTQLFHIIQEALNNTLKHAAATIVRIRLQTQDGATQLEIADNGRGFDLEEAAAAGGLGLVSMRERVERLGGLFNLNSTPGRGTIIQVTLTTTDDNGQQIADTHL